MRRPILASLIAIAFVFAGCVDPPPPPPKVAPPPPPVVTAEPTVTAAPEPPRGDGTAASPYHLIAGRAQPVELRPPPLRSVGVALQERADLVLTWTGTISPPLDVWSTIGSVKCDKSPCVIPAAPFGEYELRVASGPKQTISATALALPTAPALKPGKAVVLKPKPVAEGDPRGAIADATMQFDTSGPRSIDLRPLGKKRANDLDGLLRKVHVRVYGKYGPVRQETALSPDAGGALRVTFQASSGPYTVRLTRDTDDMADAVEVKLHKDTETKPDLGGIRSPPPRDDFAKLAIGAKVDVDVTPPEEPQRAYFDVPPDNDLAVLRRATDNLPQPSVTLYAEWPGNSRSRTCFGTFGHCMILRPHPGIYQVFSPPQNPIVTATVDVVALPHPKLAGTLSVGAKMDVTTESLAEKDPRGAIAEVALDVPAAAKYQVIVSFTEGKPVPSGNGYSFLGPELEIFGPDATDNASIVDGATSLDMTTMVATMILTTKSAGTYILRVGMQDATKMTEVTAKPRKARIEFTESKVVSNN